MNIYRFFRRHREAEDSDYAQMRDHVADNHGMDVKWVLRRSLPASD
jgi:hypothetical protein